MLTSLIMQMLLVAVTRTPSCLDLSAPQYSKLDKCQTEKSVLAHLDPIHGPDPNREIHDNGLPINNPDPYGGSTSNGSDPYGGRFGGSDPYGGRAGNTKDPYSSSL